MNCSLLYKQHEQLKQSAKVAANEYRKRLKELENAVSSALEQAGTAAKELENLRSTHSHERISLEMQLSTVTGQAALDQLNLNEWWKQAWESREIEWLQQREQYEKDLKNLSDCKEQIAKEWRTARDELDVARSNLEIQLRTSITAELTSEHDEVVRKLTCDHEEIVRKLTCEHMQMAVKLKTDKTKARNERDNAVATLRHKSRLITDYKERIRQLLADSKKLTVLVNKSQRYDEVVRMVTHDKRRDRD